MHIVEVSNKFFRGSGRLDGTKMVVFDQKMHIFVIFGWFLAQLATFRARVTGLILLKVT